jgi:hypothetical protein
MRSCTYSPDPQGDPLEPRVDEDPLPQSDSAYRYRYQGSNLLTRSNGRYFLLPEN